MSSIALKLPNSYVEIERDEMEYVDGGSKNWWNKTDAVGIAIDATLIGVTGGVSFFSTRAAVKCLKEFRGPITRTLRSYLLKHFGSAAAGAAASAVDFALTVGGTSIGGMLATGLDYADGCKDGYVFA